MRRRRDRAVMLDVMRIVPMPAVLLTGADVEWI
jgi:hypothetical protein